MSGKFDMVAMPDVSLSCVSVIVSVDTINVNRF